MDALAALIEGFLSPIAGALSSVVFFSVTLCGVSVPLVVAWLAAGALFFYRIPRLYQYSRLLVGSTTC